MQYAQVELQPIETCTHAWKTSFAMRRELRREVLVRAEPAPLDRIAADCDPVAEMRDRAGPERDVDERVVLEDPLALRLGVAAADGDDEIRPLALPCRRVAEVRRQPRVRLLADGARVEDDDVGVVGARPPRPRPSDSSMPLIRSESWAFIWHPNVVTW